MKQIPRILLTGLLLVALFGVGLFIGGWIRRVRAGDVVTTPVSLPTLQPVQN